MKALFNCSQFSPECIILCLIYINRIIALTGLPLQPSNWRPLILVALMVSQKVWDDKYLSNADFSYIYPFFDTKQLNRLEMKFLELIQYNVHIKDSLYAKYFFELKGMFPEEIPFKPLDANTMKKLDTQTKKKEESFKQNYRSNDEFKQPGEYTLHIIN